MNMRTKILLYLVLLAVLDSIIPIPFTTILLIYVLLEKPGWFYDLVMKVYQGNNDN